MNPKLFFCIALIIGIGYSTFVLIFGNEFIWQWLNTFIASFISISFAFTSGLILFNHQSSTNKRKRIEQLTLIITAEISDIKQLMTSHAIFVVNVENNKNMGLLLTYIQPLSIEEAIKSGYFDVVVTETMTLLARKIRYYNSMVTHSLSLLANSVGILNTNNLDVLLSKAASDLETTRLNIISDIDLLTMQMNLTLSSSSLMSQSNSTPTQLPA